MASFLTYSLITPIYILVKDHNIFVKYICLEQRSTLSFFKSSPASSTFLSLSVFWSGSSCCSLWLGTVVCPAAPSSSSGVMLSLLVSTDKFACRHKTAGPPEDGVVRVLGVAAAPYQKSVILSANTIRATSPQNSCEK